MKIESLDRSFSEFDPLDFNMGRRKLTDKLDPYYKEFIDTTYTEDLDGDKYEPGEEDYVDKSLEIEE